MRKAHRMKNGEAEVERVTALFSIFRTQTHASQSSPLRHFVENPPQQNLCAENDEAEDDARVSGATPSAIRRAMPVEQTDAAHEYRARTEKYAEVWHERVGDESERRHGSAVVTGHLKEWLHFCLLLSRSSLLLAARLNSLLVLFDESLLLQVVGRAQRICGEITVCERATAGCTEACRLAPRRRAARGTFTLSL